MTDDFLPPTGPPPPKVPEGWTPRWNSEYKEWFFVNIYTKKSQWDKPTEPVYPPNSDGAVSNPLGAIISLSGPLTSGEVSQHLLALEWYLEEEEVMLTSR
jgi:hypothetical protein